MLNVKCVYVKIANIGKIHSVSETARAFQRKRYIGSLCEGWDSFS
jgi:hypothetical protein